MGIFKNKKEERECYIDKRILDAKKLKDCELQREIYLKEFYLIELSGEIKSAIPSILITILLAIANITMAWVTISNNLLSNSMTATKTVIELKEELSNEEKKDITEVFSEVLDENKELIVIAINCTTILLIISLGSFLISEFSRNRKNKEKAVIEIELNILREELNCRKENATIKNKPINNTTMKEVAIGD